MKELLNIVKREKDCLSQLVQILEKQTECFEADSLDVEEYDRLDAGRDECIEQISKLSEAFAKKEKELRDAKVSLPVELNQLNEELKEMLDQYQSFMNQLKEKMERYFGEQKKEISNRRNQRKSAATYYKTMNKQMEMMSYLYDKSN